MISIHDVMEGALENCVNRRNRAKRQVADSVLDLLRGLALITTLVFSTHILGDAPPLTEEQKRKMREDEERQWAANRKRDFEFLRRTHGEQVDRFDLDRNGEFNDEEQNAFAIVFERLAKARWQKIASRYDVNKDRILDWSEQRKYEEDSRNGKFNQGEFKFDFHSTPLLLAPDEAEIKTIPQLPPWVNHKAVTKRFPFDAAKVILEWPDTSLGPYPEFVKWLKPSDKPRLLRAYRSRDLPGRARLASALAQVGGEDTVRILIRTLEKDYSNKRLSDEAMRSFVDILTGLGMLAAKSETAFGYLTNHLTPESWSRNFQWQSRIPDFEPSITLAGCSMQALGFSGRSIVPNLLKDIIDSKPKYLRRVAGGIIDAHYRLSMVRAQGLSHFLQRSFGDCTMTNFRRWIGTDEGKSWMQWQNQIEAESLRKPDH
jgi:hypothetical protein